MEEGEIEGQSSEKEKSEMEETAKFEKELVAFLPLLPHVGECGAASDTYNVVVMRDA